MKAISTITPSELNLLMLRTKSLKYFAFLSMEFEKQIVYDNPETPYVEVQEKTLVYHLQKHTSLAIAVALTVHTMLHLISYHTGRARSRDEILWNIGCDHVVNTIIRRMSSSMRSGVCKLPENHIYFPELDEKYPDSSAEEIYSVLENMAERNQLSFSFSKNSITVTSKHGYTMQGGGDTSQDSKNLSGISQERIEALRNSANLLMMSESSELKGDIDANMIRYLSQIFDLKQIWDEILKQSLLYYSKSLESRTWTRRNIYIPHYRLPGYSDECNSLNTLIIAIDLSGSISDSDYNKFASILIEASAYYKQLVIMTHEVSINNFLVLRETNPDKVLEECRKFRGGGGTSHKAVFDKIEDIYLEGEYQISSIVFLTDFYSDVEEIYQKYRFIHEVTTIWVTPVVSSSHFSQEVYLAGCNTVTIPIQM